MDVHCVVCNNESFPIFIADGATIYKCRHCALEFADPMPSAAELDKLYSDYEYYTEYDRQMIRDTVKKNCRKNIDYLQRYGLSQDHKLLDFGCGENLFVQEGMPCNWAGYNYPHDALDYDAEDKYDFITLWGVLEHLPDPLGVINDLARLMAGGGKLVMTTVGTETGIPYRYRYPVHLTWWSEKSVHALLEKTGFKVLEISKYTMIQNPKFYLDRVLDRGMVPAHIKEKITIQIDEDILVPTNEILIVGEKT